MRNAIFAGLLITLFTYGNALAQQERDWDAVELTITHVSGGVYY